ncbi:MAG: hypothetical protein IT162_23515 [Bryobacterales bacterium]|nr:hypothetical protein [Bryobacterales bacterium]
MSDLNKLGGFIRTVFINAVTNATLSDVEQKLKDVDRAMGETSKRWDEFMASPAAKKYANTRSVNDQEQTRMIVDLENLLGKVAAVTQAQHGAMQSMLAAMKLLNKK